MSINALANAATARRTDVGDPGAIPVKLSEIAAAATTSPEKAPPKKDEAGDVGTALHVLFGYIPTEIVTLYVAVSAALVPPQEGQAGAAAIKAMPHAALAAGLPSQWIALALFVVATPVVVWVIFATKLKTSGRPLPMASCTWPMWEMSAATISFCAWAYALPETPFRYFANAYSPAMGSIAVLFASTALGLVAPLFQRPLPIGATTEEPPAIKRSATIAIAPPEGASPGSPTADGDGARPMGKPSAPGLPNIEGG